MTSSSSMCAAVEGHPTRKAQVTNHAQGIAVISLITEISQVTCASWTHSPNRPTLAVLADLLKHDCFDLIGQINVPNISINLYGNGLFISHNISNVVYMPIYEWLIYFWYYLRRCVCTHSQMKLTWHKSYLEGTDLFFYFAGYTGDGTVDINHSTTMDNQLRFPRFL